MLRLTCIVCSIGLSLLLLGCDDDEAGPFSRGVPPRPPVVVIPDAGRPDVGSVTDGGGEGGALDSVSSSDSAGAPGG